MSDTSMGDYLRAARRRRRVSIEKAAEETRIRPDYLMRMESDEFDFLAATYVRGFLRTYARYLAVNEEPLLEDFDRRYGRSRTETSTIAALEARARSAPRQRRRISSWGVAAVLATILIAAMAVVGTIFAPEETPTRSDVARNENNGSQSDGQPQTQPTTEPEEEAEPSVEPTPDERALAQADEIELEIKAVNGDCWIDVTSDGANVASETMPVGTSQTFTADEDMDVLLGLPDSVELIVNGQNIGSPGGSSPITISLPEDIDSLSKL